jgi:AcrR family transcriptional regulator
MKAEDRRNQLLDTAAQIVRELGVSAVTMDSVTQRAGVTRRVAYFHFDNTDALLVALLDREMSADDDRLTAVLDGDVALRERVSALVRIHFDGLRERGGVLEALASAHVGDDATAKRQTERYRSLIERLAEAIRREHAMRKRHAMTAAAILVRAVEGATDAWVAGLLPRREIEELFTDLALAAVASVATEPPG